MKIVKWVCSILLLLLGVGLAFVGAAGSWESLTSGQPVGLILMLPMTTIGAGLFWLGIRLLRGRSGKKAQAHELSEQEKADQETESRIRAAQEEAQRKAVWEAQERQRQEEQRWLEERPALKAQFDYLQVMLQRDALSFYDPSGEEYRRMSDSRNRTGGEWMRTLPVYDLERVIEFYQALRDARDRLSQEELSHAPYGLCGTINALTHRRLYLRLNSEHQLTALGDRKDALLERCREQDIHLVLQPSRNEIVDLTHGMAYELHAEEMGLNPLTDEIVGGEVTLGPANEPGSSTKGRENSIDEELYQKLRVHEEQRRQKLLAYAQTLEPEARSRLERASNAFFHRMLWGVHPKYVEDPNVNDVLPVWDCFAVSADADLSGVLDVWLDTKATARLSSDAFTYFRNHHYYRGGVPTFILSDAAQMDRSTGGKAALLQRCQEYRASLMLDLGDGYYQSLLDGAFYKFAVGATLAGSADDAATYGELCWTKIGSLLPAPPMDWSNSERSSQRIREI